MLALTSVDRDGRPCVPDSRQPLVLDVAGGAVADGWREGDDVLVHVRDVASYRFRGAVGDVVAVAEPGVGDEDVHYAYRSTALPVILQATSRWEVFHASAVATEAGVLALCGASEAGKTTLGYGLARRGHVLWADDAVAFRVAAHGVETCALDFEVGLREASVAHFDQASVEVERASRSSRSILVGLVIVEPGDREPTLEELAPSDALLALLPNAYRFRPSAPERERRMLQAYLEFVALVPVRRLSYPKRFASLGPALDAVTAAFP
jgi:hypothetical protein